ncbi:uncharacterized protein LOC121735061 [Aricia agestis]|uniref:uncharacterized protein LOC121735061 n=1 Tax=Aricia agestis TaxID=91739 RepID=UPI001C207C8B|nr:uncharacterized protein LOC121735061 [Aricia agestis]
MNRRDDGGSGRGPIDVVTRRQFATVEASLEQLQAAASAHRLADRGDVAEEVKRLAARVQAAEQAAGQLAATVCELAECGALPRELRVAVQALGYPPEHRRSRRSSIFSAPPYVTRYDLDAIMSDATAELTGAVVAATARAAESAEWALRKAQAVGEKMERASSLSVRLSTLQALVEDYFQQTAGFETGLTTQIRQFQEQIEQIEADLGAGLDQLKHVNTNTETAAVIALRERYEDLVAQAEATAADGQAAAADQAKLAREIHNLAQALENLKEQKCDRAEVVDGLRDKATSSQLQGLLRVEVFERTRDELDDRLDAFHDLFHEQETRWMEALKELSDRVELKAQYSELLHARDEAQAQLRTIDDRLRTLAHAIGEPQVAFLTRSLLADMLCASCREPALPDARPAHLHTHSDGESISPRKERHACRRWCGGSHTLVAGTRALPSAPPAPRPPRPARTYSGYGDDGRLYQMQEDCQPCLQCNKVEHSTSQHGRGDGDQK